MTGGFRPSHSKIPATIERALEVAQLAADFVRGSTSPNPPVGAVILSATGEVVGVGATHPPGGDHAEIIALAEAGRDAMGGTAVVTLEPCNHSGRTGPCTEALIDAGIRRVVFAHHEPNPIAQGGGERLAAAAVGYIMFYGTAGVISKYCDQNVPNEWVYWKRIPEVGDLHDPPPFAGAALSIYVIVGKCEVEVRQRLDRMSKLVKYEIDGSLRS